MGNRIYGYTERPPDWPDFLPDFLWREKPPPCPQWVIDWAQRHAPRAAATPSGGDGGGRIEEGQRNTRLTSLGGAMRDKGFEADDIYAALSSLNERDCDPPVPDDEVRTIADSVARYEPTRPMGRISGIRNGHKAEQKTAPFPVPIPASKLAHLSGATWLWHGYLSRGSITLFSALWKAGKTTLLAHMLKAMEEGKEFCKLQLQPCKVLYVTEESENHWATRRDELGLADHIEFLVCPFNSKPSWEAWQSFLTYLGSLVAERKYDLIVFDTLVNLWPIRDENDASQVQSALMPVRALSRDAAILLVHHNRKGDGIEATASRGSGALTAFVDTILEFRRYQASDRKDCRRVITGYGRFDETTDELVVELTDDGFVVHGDRQEMIKQDIETVLLTILPNCSPGVSYETLMDEWPGETRPRKQRFLNTLRSAHEAGRLMREGEGIKGSPYTYWAPPPP